MRKRAFWITVVLSLAFTWWGWWGTPNAFAFNEEQKLLLQSWRLVNQAYIDDTFNHQNWWFMRQELLQRPLASREETYDAIDEMLASLEEPFTRLIRPEQYHNLQISTAGELSGVGLQINLNAQTGEVEVVSPIAGSPAEAQGIEAGDRILTIDGVDTTTLTLDEAATKMRGPSGTSVVLTLQPHQQPSSEIRTVKIVRQRIELSPVISRLDHQNGTIPIGYIRLNQFSANAAEEVAQAIHALENQGAEGYILDLRNNPGGLLQVGIEIARLWLDQGTIVYTVNRQGVLDSFMANDSALTMDPLVVLVNQGTASASEILAGALQDNQRGILVGEKTFGKGLIQSLFELPDGAGLAITVAKYETPNHKDIHKQGIVPDQKIVQDPVTYTQLGTDVDQQYQTAIKLLTQKTVLANAG